MSSYRMRILVLFLLGGLVTKCQSQQEEEDSDQDENVTSTTTTTGGTTATTTNAISLAFVMPMKNYSKVAGDSLKIKCEVRGQPPALKFRWFKNEAPLKEERGRVKIRSKTGSGDTQWSRVRFHVLETMDMGYYRCEASNGVDTVRGECVVKIHPGNKRKGTSYWSDDDYDDDYHENAGLIPESFPLDLDASLGSGVIAGLPSHIEFQGRAPDDFKNGKSVPSNNNVATHHAASTGAMNGNMPSLKPNERSGRCQRYTGSVCSQHVGSNYIFVSQGLTQDYIEQKLQASFQVITNSPDLSKECAKYAIPAICLSTLPLCDRQTQRPRKVLHFFVSMLLGLINKLYSPTFLLF
jgi:hypothetical protein